ncbi:nucleotidyltransferase domain-containing protein [Blastococcus sp. PRF04-17]|uniref:nucleotidyltransferase domain-containing protein n=1 Tax=Blastococcus sp. PRF04-17 TaxID=2933797 RepID=UPI001FF2534F|nr:nucleotidyltransferase domain-containing protein [Blastococcus sp. PRF04-17]UOY03068.1 nucleotidyltransferase domain-containing protein [Blastococcus sp. PRF04-17]
MISHGGAAEVESVLGRLTAWARQQPDVRALALVGSWARGAAHGASDVDVVLLTDSPERYVVDDDWPAEVGGERLLTTRRWGPLTERRFLLGTGLEVDFCVGPPAWASVDPLDPGTAAVVSAGMRSLHDPDGALATLAAAVAARRRLRRGSPGCST